MSLPVDTGIALKSGDSLVGTTSGATATLVLEPVILSGTVSLGTAVLRISLENLVGTFQAAETLIVNGVTSSHTVNNSLITAITAPVCTQETL